MIGHPNDKGAALLATHPRRRLESDLLNVKIITYYTINILRAPPGFSPILFLAPVWKRFINHVTDIWVVAPDSVQLLEPERGPPVSISEALIAERVRVPQIGPIECLAIWPFFARANFLPNRQRRLTSGSADCGARNVNLRSDASTNGAPIETLKHRRSKRGPCVPQARFWITSGLPTIRPDFVTGLWRGFSNVGGS